ncbi:MAG: PAS domain S-box protein [Synechococcus sp.]
MTRDRTGRIREFLLQPGDGLLLVDGDGRVSHIDETALRQLGNGSAALLGQPLAEHWSALAAVIERHRPALASQGPLEEHLPRGQSRLHLRLFRTDDGVGVGLLHEPTATRGDSGPEPLLGLLLQQVRDAVLVSRVTASDPPGAVILYANEAALRQSGYERHELLGRSPARLLGPQTDPRQRERLEEARRRGDPLSLELIQHHRDGTPYWVECDETPLPLEGIEGGLRLIVQRDVTLRHRQEEASRRQAEGYRILAESANAVVFRARPDGVTLWVSDAITSLTGWRPEELTGLPLAGFVHPDDLDVLHQTDAAFLRGEGVRCEFRVRCRSGHHRWVAMQGRGVRGNNGQVKELVGGWRDIEAHKQAELQLAA